METEIKEINAEELKQLIMDVALIKKILSIHKKDPEGELTEWAKKQLEISRSNPSGYFSHEEVKKIILSKK